MKGIDNDVREKKTMEFYSNITIGLNEVKVDGLIKVSMKFRNDRIENSNRLSCVRYREGKDRWRLKKGAKQKLKS